MLKSDCFKWLSFLKRNRMTGQLKGKWKQQDIKRRIIQKNRTLLIKMKSSLMTLQLMSAKCFSLAILFIRFWPKAINYIWVGDWSGFHVKNKRLKSIMTLKKILIHKVKLIPFYACFIIFIYSFLFLCHIIYFVVLLYGKSTLKLYCHSKF